MRLVLCVALALFASGCKAKRPKSAVPVVGPPPVRTTLANDTNPPTEAELLAGHATVPGDLRQVDFTSSNVIREFDETEVVAYVDGEPILAGEVLEPYAGQLKQIRAQAPPEQFAALRKQLLQRDLPLHIDNRVLIQAFHSSLTKDQRDNLDQAMDMMFDKQVEEMKARFGIHTDHELDLELQKSDSSLATIRQAFANKVMAQEFLRGKLPNFPEPTRIELVDYYQEHLDEYRIAARARWEQIQISYGQHGGKNAASEVLYNAADELRNGVDFAEVARKYSDGPTAKQGGLWDWTQPGSLKDKNIDRAIFSIPVGQISDVFVGDSAFQIIRVVERQPEGHVPFEQLQDEIKQKLVVDRRRGLGDQILADMRSQKNIQTIFDHQQSAGSNANDDPFRPLVQPSRPAPQRGQARPLPLD